MLAAHQARAQTDRSQSLLQIERMSLEAEHMGDPAVAPRDQQGHPSSPAWRAEPVKLELPPRQPPILVELSGTPLVKGFFVMTGCRMSCMGVTWHQSWTARPPTLGEQELAQCSTLYTAGI